MFFFYSLFLGWFLSSNQLSGVLYMGSVRNERISILERNGRGTMQGMGSVLVAFFVGLNELRDLRLRQVTS